MTIESPERSLNTSSLYNSIDSAYTVAPSLARLSPETTDYGLLVLSHILDETANILRVTIPPVEFFYDTSDKEELTLAEVRGTHGNNNLRLRIELGYFLEQADRLQGNNSAAVIQDLKETFGEEMYHVYVAQHYPHTHAITQFANDISGAAYRKDRGEKAAKAFGYKYAEGVLSRRRLIKVA